jgi:hypothetical protein
MPEMNSIENTRFDFFGTVVEDIATELESTSIDIAEII